jgi:hypothetical protein
LPGEDQAHEHASKAILFLKPQESFLFIMIAYTVAATFNESQVADEWIDWLRSEHLTDVLACGALDAEVIRLDGEPCRCEVRYHFESRDSFSSYERNHAPSLRAEGLKRFPPERGITYARSLGPIVLSR